MFQSTFYLISFPLKKTLYILPSFSFASLLSTALPMPVSLVYFLIFLVPLCLSFHSFCCFLLLSLLSTSHPLPSFFLDCLLCLPFCFFFSSHLLSSLFFSSLPFPFHPFPSLPSSFVISLPALCFPSHSFFSSLHLLASCLSPSNPPFYSPPPF